MTTFNGWTISKYRNDYGKTRWGAVKFGVRLSGFDSLDGILYALRNRLRDYTRYF